MLQNSFGIIYLEPYNRWDKKTKVKCDKRIKMSNGKVFAVYVCHRHA
jgi:hypothetical protein